ncbi:MAG: hypothetical protein WBM77_00815 [Maribacter sp.]
MSLFIFAIILSCNGQKKAAMKDKNDMNMGNEKLTLLLQDNYSGSDVAETLVIKDVKALKSFYSKINKTRKPGLPVPEVDFTKEMILVHCSGEQKNGKQALLSVEEENEEEVIITTSVKKSKKSSTSSAIISPFSIYKMPLTSKEISFKAQD